MRTGTPANPYGNNNASKLHYVLPDIAEGACVRI